ncbi:MAG: hypothetical protein N3D80_03935 [Ignavibacterium album]|uniref:hypothetical protein n=1 Tax=Ignavibacterium album TaxID=591197 RepID=UPI0026F155E2|nr:hypothetical protein [Ignavibacterium album]MCX8105008.1 hypothetical protein [Ignavibacterium album]
MILLKLSGSLNSSGEIILNPLKSVRWEQISDTKLPNLPDSLTVGISLTIDEDEFLLGKDGIVWATVDLRQAEIIQSSLLVQQINSEIMKTEFPSITLFLIRIPQINEINAASDFIWRSQSGLRLLPDWNYPDGDTNQSFEIWLKDN